MSKKWLYSVAAAALLIAGQAAGITIHDVLSNGFWSTQERATEMSLNAETTDNYKEKYKKETETPREDERVSGELSSTDPLRVGLYRHHPSCGGWYPLHFQTKT